MSYHIQVAPSAVDALGKLAKEAQAPIITKIRGLAERPLPDDAHRIANGDRMFRVGHGVYRIIYQTCDSTELIWVLCIRHRDYDN